MVVAFGKVQWKVVGLAVSVSPAESSAVTVIGHTSHFRFFAMAELMLGIVSE